MIFWVIWCIHYPFRIHFSEIHVVIICFLKLIRIPENRIVLYLRLTKKICQAVKQIQLWDHVPLGVMKVHESSYLQDAT